MPGTELFAALLGSVALLLWGVRMVRTGLTRAFGPALRRILATWATTRPRAFLAGLGVTLELLGVGGECRRRSDKQCGERQQQILHFARTISLWLI